jgi:hypothetical protein
LLIRLRDRVNPIALNKHSNHHTARLPLVLIRRSQQLDITEKSKLTIAAFQDTRPFLIILPAQAPDIAQTPSLQHPNQTLAHFHRATS